MTNLKLEFIKLNRNIHCQFLKIFDYIPLSLKLNLRQKENGSTKKSRQKLKASAAPDMPRDWLNEFVAMANRERSLVIISLRKLMKLDMQLLNSTILAALLVCELRGLIVPG